MVDVVGDEQLELAMGGAAGGPATIDEVFLHAADFGDVKVGGHDILVGQDEVEVGVRMGAEGGNKGGSGEGGHGEGRWRARRGGLIGS